MKRINAMLLAGSLLIAGALTETASAQNYYNNGYGFGNNGYYNYYNQGGLSRFINRTSNKLVGTPILGNRWNNGSFCDNNYNGGYWNNRPGIVSRIFNRIF